MRRQVVVPYSPRWPELFETEREVLERVLAPWLKGGIHHVGSTAVAGLAAKPVIDIIAGVRDLEEARAAIRPLEPRGYGYRPHRPEAHLFTKPSGAEWWEQTHALHLTGLGSDLWRERLAFRDALRADPALASQYEQWKLTHAATSGSSGPYEASKTPFVTAVVAACDIDLRPDSERLDPTASGQHRAALREGEQ